MYVCMYLRTFVCVCVSVFLSCEITSKTKMIVVTEAWVRTRGYFLHN